MGDNCLITVGSCGESSLRWKRDEDSGASQLLCSRPGENVALIATVSCEGGGPWTCFAHNRVNPARPWFSTFKDEFSAKVFAELEAGDDTGNSLFTASERPSFMGMKWDVVIDSKNQWIDVMLHRHDISGRVLSLHAHVKAKLDAESGLSDWDAKVIGGAVGYGTSAKYVHHVQFDMMSDLKSALDAVEGEIVAQLRGEKEDKREEKGNPEPQPLFADYECMLFDTTWRTRLVNATGPQAAAIAHVIDQAHEDSRARDRAWVKVFSFVTHGLFYVSLEKRGTAASDWGHCGTWMHDDAQANHVWIFYPDDDDPLTSSKVKVVELPGRDTLSCTHYQLIIDDEVVTTECLATLWQMFRYVEARLREGTLVANQHRRDPEFVSAFLQAMRDDSGLHDLIVAFEAGVRGALSDEWFKLDSAKKFEDDWLTYARIRELVEKKKK